MDLQVRQAEEKIRKSPWSSLLGGSPFQWSKLPVSSKNLLFKLITSEGEFVVKIFAGNSSGQKSADSEYRAFESLSAWGLKSFPECVGHFENGVVTRYLPEGFEVSPAEAYGHLEKFLIQTRNLTVDWRVAHDSGCKKDFLLNLDLRRKAFKTEPCRSLSRIYRYLESERTVEFSEREKRFILSDFYPGQMIRSRQEIYFLDLEHGGMGDPRRFLCNLLLHPKGSLSLSQLRSLQKILGVNSESLNSVFPFSFTEWVLIVLNFLSGPQLDEVRVKLRKEEATRRILQALRWMETGDSWLELYLEERSRG